MQASDGEKKNLNILSSVSGIASAYACTTRAFRNPFAVPSAWRRVPNTHKWVVSWTHTWFRNVIKSEMSIHNYPSNTHVHKIVSSAGISSLYPGKVAQVHPQLYPYRIMNLKQCWFTAPPRHLQICLRLSHVSIRPSHLCLQNKVVLCNTKMIPKFNPMMTLFSSADAQDRCRYFLLNEVVRHRGNSRAWQSKYISMLRMRLECLKY